MLITLAVAGLAQGLAGFGAGLVAMPILMVILGPAIAAPMFSLVAIALEIVMATRYRHSLTLGAVWRLIVAAIVAIPIGIFGSPYIDDRVLIAILGSIVLGYGLFGLFAPQLPKLQNPRWAYAFGFIAGLLSGAYNTGGPPYVIYGTTQRWTASEFKANLQGVFVVGSSILIISHVIRGSYTLHTIQLAALGIPTLLTGLFIGLSLDRFVRPDVFRRGVQVLLVALGISLISRALG
jgi:uncharacterized membrane protein YfcA